METEQMALILQKTEDRARQNQARIDKLEQEHQVLHQLATSVAVLAEQMHTMSRSMTTLATEVDTLKVRPARRWDALVAALLSAIVALAVGRL